MQKVIDTVEEFWNRDDLIKSRLNCTSSSIMNFQYEFSKYIGVETDAIYLMPSGKKALEWLLKSANSNGRTVMIPAFNCSVVKDAVIELGLSVLYYDFSYKEGIFDWRDVLDNLSNDIGVIVVTHLFGVPVNFLPIIEFCRAKGITIIEDCAHTLGGEISNKMVGTHGDAAIFSFNYDKPISLGWGGCALINNKQSFSVQSNFFSPPPPDEEMSLLETFTSVMSWRRKNISRANSLKTRLLKKMKILKPRKFSNDSSYSIGSIQAELGILCLQKYPQIVKKRKLNAINIASSITYESWPVEEKVKPAWLKQKIKIPNKKLLSTLSKRLQSKGIRAGNFNWPRLVDPNGLKNCPSSFNASVSWMDIPIHQNMDNEHIDTIITTLR